MFYWGILVFFLELKKYISQQTLGYINGSIYDQIVYWYVSIYLDIPFDLTQVLLQPYALQY